MIRRVFGRLFYELVFKKHADGRGVGVVELAIAHREDEGCKKNQGYQ